VAGLLANWGYYCISGGPGRTDVIRVCSAGIETPSLRQQTLANNREEREGDERSTSRVTFTTFSCLW